MDDGCGWFGRKKEGRNVRRESARRGLSRGTGWSGCRGRGKVEGADNGNRSCGHGRGMVLERYVLFTCSGCEGIRRVGWDGDWECECEHLLAAREFGVTRVFGASTQLI